MMPLWPSATAIPACCLVTEAMTAIAYGRTPETGAHIWKYPLRAAARCSIPSASASALRARIKCLITRLKNCRRVATRYAHTATNSLGFALLSCIHLWIRFVHPAYTPGAGP